MNGDEGLDEKVKDEDQKQCMPVEDAEEAVRVKVIPSPNAPSRQELLEHNITHMPFRSWCPHCVAGKAKANKHVHSGGLEGSETPVVSMDYMFMGDKNVESVADDKEDHGESYDVDDKDETKAKILVIKDVKSRVCAAVPVPRKGVDNEEWSVKETLRFLEFLGYTSLVMKTDQEAALKSLMSKVRAHRGDQTQTMHEMSPVGDSKANGFVERSIQSVQGQIRTLRSALESRIGVRVDPMSPIFAWLVIHAANLMNLCEIGRDGRVPYQRLRGRKLHPELVEFGECVFYQPLKHLDLGKAEARWHSGVFLGIKINTGERVISTADGIIKVRSIRRKLESERWNSEECDLVKRFPWRPYENSEEDQVHIRVPLPVTPPQRPEIKEPVQRDGDAVPRPFSIQKKDLVNYGYTPGCPGCLAAANDRRYKPHTFQCRQRLEKAMLEDEEGSNRVKEARYREDAYLEQKVREADEASKASAQQRNVEVHHEDREVVGRAAQPSKPFDEINNDSSEVPPAVPAETETMSWEQILDENNFHDIVNDDADMYAEIDSLPGDTDNMVAKIIGIVQNHVSEVWSQPRVTKLAKEFGLSPGFALDLQVNDEDGQPWDFDKVEQREKCIRLIQEQKPMFLIGSPMCTAFSALQNLNKWRMDTKKWNALQEQGVRHMRFAIKLYRMQADAGRFFLHEHPNSASSWKMPEMLELVNQLKIQRTVAHMCRYGMKSSDELGSGRVKKPTGFLTNSEYLRDQLSNKCLGGHRHIQLMGGKARACQVYPDKLCRAILKGIRQELVHSGFIEYDDKDMMVVGAQNDEPEEYIEEYVDDMSGQILDTHLVREARQLEMKKFSEHEVYTKVPISEAIHVTGKKPIGSRWIDINKGDSSNPNYRSRLVAKEIKREADEGMFAAMPPLEAKKCLFSMVMTQFARARCKVQRPKTKLLFIGVSRAYFYAPARRPVYVALPQEDYEEGMCGRLNVSMYGTRDAAANWEAKYADHLVLNGFRRGKSSPCVFWHPITGVRCVVHGDDFTFAGEEEELRKCTEMMKAEYEVKVRGLLGPDKDDDKSITILNRCVEWTPQGIRYEADPRHVEILVKQLDLANTKPVTTPGVKGAPIPEEEDSHLDPSSATQFRQLIARCNFLCHDRVDIQYAVKEAAKGMANPKKSDHMKLVRIAKYLKGRPRYVVLFRPQKDVDGINGYSDSDFAGDVESRKSTSGGTVMIGDHMVKSWSTSQSVIALSTGEAELYGLNKCGASALGLQSLLEDLGVTLDIRLHTDATTGKAIATRRGLGKVRHIAVNELWLQEQVSLKKVVINKLKNKFNVADILTKHLSKYDVDQIVDFLQHEFSEGRNADAPELSLLTGKDQDHANELHVALPDGLGKRCWCTGEAKIL